MSSSTIKLALNGKEYNTGLNKLLEKRKNIWYIRILQSL